MLLTNAKIKRTLISEYRKKPRYDLITVMKIAATNLMGCKNRN